MIFSNTFECSTSYLTILKDNLEQDAGYISDVFCDVCYDKRFLLFGIYIVVLFDIYIMIFSSPREIYSFRLHKLPGRLPIRLHPKTLLHIAGHL